MKPFLVHLHIYYTDMWEELRGKLESISSYKYDFYVTLVQENEILTKKILEFNPNAHIEIVENRGFDVGPFVHIINKINLDNYSYVIKVHTKRSSNEVGMHVNHFDMNGTKWRDSLLKFLSSKDEFNKNLNFLEKNLNIAMNGSYKLLVNSKNESQKTRKVLDEFYQKYNIEKSNFYFIAGTMFIARANIFKKLQEMNFKIEDFETPNKEVRDKQLAHKVERLIGLIAYQQGYVIEDFFTPKYQQMLMYTVAKLKKFIYQNKITSSGRHIIKICTIPIYWKK